MKVETKLYSFDGYDFNKRLFGPVVEREGFSENETQLIVPQIACRFLGFEGDEDDYFNLLFEMSQKENVVVLSETLDKTIDPNDFTAIQEILETQKKERLSMNRFMAHLGGKRLIPHFQEVELNRLVHQLFISLIEEFNAEHPTGMQHPDFRRTFIDLVKFSKNHYEKWVKEKGLKNLPKVIWYGEASKSQQYFLRFLMLSGFDVLLYDPEGKDNFQLVDPKEEKTIVKKYSNTCAIQPFPKEKRQRRATVAYQASKEMERVLHSEDSLFFKPWQLRDYTPRHLTLKTTYDELFGIARADSFIRQGFEVGNGSVLIPTVFAKISGITHNKREYWDRLHMLTENPMTLTIKQFPFTKEVNAQTFLYHYKNAQTNGKLDPEKVINGNYWRYKQLPLSLQRGIATAICRYTEKPQLLPIANEKPENISLYLFAQSSNIPTEILQLLQKFDYSKQVPKLLLYNNENNGMLSRSDAGLLLLLNELGVDIVLYNPPGHTDLELYMKQDVYDAHLLDEMSFNQEFQEPNLIGRFLKRFKG